MASFTSKATGNWDATGATTWNEAGTPGAGDDVTIQNTHVVTQTQNEACAGLTIDSGGELDIATYDLDNSSTADITGTLTIGSSSGDGFVCVGFTANSGASVGLQGDSRIENSGGYTVANEAIWVTNNRGEYNQTASANGSAPSASNLFSVVTVNAGATFTATADLSLSGVFGATATINGIIAGGANTFSLGGAMTIGTAGDFTGSGTFKLYNTNGTFTNNRTTAFSYTGLVTSPPSSVATTRLPAWDFSSANMSMFGGGGAGARTRGFSSGTLCCVDLAINNTDADVTTTVDNDVQNTSFEISGDLDINETVGSIVWTAGTGTIKLNGTDQSIDLGGKDVETIFSDSTIGDVTIIAGDTWDIGTLDLTTDALTVAGTLEIGVSASNGLTCAGLTFNSGGTLTMAVSSASKINNSGNFSMPNEAVFTTARGDYTQTSSGTYANPKSSATWYNFTIDAGATLTASGLIYIMRNGSGTTTINGTLACGTSTVNIGSNIIIGSSGDITGTGGILQIFSPASDTLTNNRATAFTYSSSVQIIPSTADDLAMPAWDFSNANVKISGTASTSESRCICPGTLKCIDLTYVQAGGFTLTVDNSSTNPNIEISGNLDMGVVGTLTYTAGTGTITHTGTGNIDTGGETIEAFVVNSSGTTTMTAAFDALSFTGTAGTLDPNGQTVTTTGSFVTRPGFIISDPVSTDFVIGGSMTLCGSSGDILDLTASGAWTVSVTGTSTIKFADIQNLDSSGGVDTYAQNSTDSGSNTSVVFITVEGSTASIVAAFVEIIY